MKINTEVLMWTGGAVAITSLVVLAAKGWFGSNIQGILDGILSGIVG
ncbi:hypothetical protein [Lysinibacillus fusiformis]|nr:hypothetical protein [Lysinibacillus fusiformis]MED4672374.1 hypothetical protein [Lysinibacillus fusiformis]GED65585.1 hypothetical protein LFU01_40370 [Lysinibacillus fusiformis]